MRSSRLRRRSGHRARMRLPLPRHHTRSPCMADLRAVSLDELLAIDRNRQHFKRLRDQVHSAMGAVPFVGAGLSIPCGMPGWTSFLLTEATRTNDLDKVKQLVDESSFEEAAQTLADALGPMAFSDVLSDAFGPDLLDGKELRGAVA